jgi:glycine/D-amino acid oxidase-like deaminating enzyme
MERYNLIVLGAGSGGLTVAAGAALIGAGVALLEKHRMGGDCLNYGCVPSKATPAPSRTEPPASRWRLPRLLVRHREDGRRGEEDRERHEHSAMPPHLHLRTS